VADDGKEWMPWWNFATAYGDTATQPLSRCP
jgi:hypothetical protein